VTTPPAAEDNRAARPAPGADVLPALYEREAFLVYTIALRVTCDPEAAQDAVEAAFLALAGGAERPAGCTVTAALARALPAGAPVAGNGMLAATAALAPPLRAALAIEALCDGVAEDVGSALALPRSAAEAVLRRAHEELATSAAAGDYEAWGWATPPEALWPRVHATVYSALAAPAPPAAPPPARRLRRPGRRVMACALAALAASAGAMAGGVLDGGRTATPATAAGPRPMPLAPAGVQVDGEDLDQLRMDELRDLKRHARAAVDRSLSPRRRQVAAERAARLRRMAERQRRAQARRQAERRRARREAAREEPVQAPEAPRPAPPRRDEPEEAIPLPDADAAPTPTATPDEQPSADREDCLYDPDNDVYVCPE
jgi:hypothetical protein